MKVGEVEDERGRHCDRVITVHDACLSASSSARCSVQVLFLQFEPSQSQLVIVCSFCRFPFSPVSRDRVTEAPTLQQLLFATAPPLSPHDVADWSLILAGQKLFEMGRWWF